jgi:hypothetical protein
MKYSDFPLVPPWRVLFTKRLSTALFGAAFPHGVVKTPMFMVTHLQVELDAAAHAPPRDAVSEDLVYSFEPVLDDGTLLKVTVWYRSGATNRHYSVRP